MRMRRVDIAIRQLVRAFAVLPILSLVSFDVFFHMHEDGIEPPTFRLPPN